MTDANKQAVEVGGLSAPAMHLLHCAELLLRLRRALVSSDWGSMTKTVAEALRVRMPEVCIPEVQAAKDELDNHTMLHQLTDALDKGHANGVVSRVGWVLEGGRPALPLQPLVPRPAVLHPRPPAPPPSAQLDLSTVDVSLLTERIAHAEEVRSVVLVLAVPKQPDVSTPPLPPARQIGPKTVQAHALLRLGKAVRKIRQELLAGNYVALPELTRHTLLSVPRELIPPHTLDELTVRVFVSWCLIGGERRRKRSPQTHK